MVPTRALVASALLAAAIGLSATFSGAATAPRSRPGPSLATCRQEVPTETLVSGKLTVATNNPAIAPWFVDDSPSNKEGYESALAYQLASLFGFKASAVAWYAEPFELATSAGTKPFDFDINEITYAKSLTTTVGLSSSYYNVNQSLVALKTNGIVKRHSPAQLRAYRYGALAGSTGLKLISTEIKPTHKPVAYKTLSAAVSGLMTKKIDAIVIDTPTGQYLDEQAAPEGRPVRAAAHDRPVLRLGAPEGQPADRVRRHGDQAVAPERRAHHALQEVPQDLQLDPVHQPVIQPVPAARRPPYT